MATLALSLEAEEAEAQIEDERASREFMRLLWKDSDKRPYQQFGRCTVCARISTDDEVTVTTPDGDERTYLRPLFVTGRTAEKFECLDCFIADREKVAAQQKAQRERHLSKVKQCPHCPKAYASRAGLLRHAKKDHPGDEV